MDVDLNIGSITVRLGGVLTYCECGGGWLVQPESVAGVEILSYSYSRPGTAWQKVNPTLEPAQFPAVATTGSVAVGTRLQPLDSLVVGFTWTTRPPKVETPLAISVNDEIMPINVVSYGPLTGMGDSLIRPTAIGNPNNSTVAFLRASPILWDNPTSASLPSVVDITALGPNIGPASPGGPTGWGIFGNPRPDVDDCISAFSGFCGELWNGWNSHGYTPHLQHPGYGGSMSSMVGQALLVVVSKEDATKRRTLARKMTQWGIDLMGAYASGRIEGADGGHYQARKPLVVLALHLLETGLSANTLFPGVFNEDNQFYTESNAWVWGWPYGYRGKTDAPTNIRDPISSWSTTTRFYLTQYFRQEVCGTNVATALAMQILGLTSEMGVAQRGMMAQWVEGPTPANKAAMIAHDPAYDFDWGGTYNTDWMWSGSPFEGASRFGRAAWDAYNTYVPDGEPPPPDPVAIIGVTGNSVAIANNDGTPSPTDHTLFGSTVVGGSTISRTFTVANTGTKDLTIANVTVPVGYTVTTALPSVIEPSTSDPLTIRLDASLAGTKVGPVSIGSDAAADPKFEFFISGTVSSAGGGSGGPSPLPPFPVPLRIKNHSTSPFRGWVRTTTDFPLTGPCHLNGCEIVPAHRIGLDVRAVDVWVNLAPGEERSVDLSAAWPRSWQPTPPPANLEAHFGGALTANGEPMTLVGVQQDGAAWRAHFATRIGRTFILHLWGRLYPDQAAIAEFECLLACSNADLPDMGESLPELRLAFGDGVLVGKLPAAGMRFADGQARAFPVFFVWPRHMSTALAWSTAGAIVHHQIGVVGISALLPGGNPVLPDTFSLKAWADEHLNRAYDGLTTWAHPMLGPAADTGQTGAVEDQCFVGGECFPPGGPGAEFLTYCAALATSGHPMHHYERDGTIVDIDRRPGLRLYYSRPHFSGTDRLNKPRDLTLSESSGWNGPDAQHWTINRLAAAARLKDSPACQQLLEHHARNYLIQLTTNPQWSTSAIWSARELGWEGIAAVHLWRCLENRALAERVKAHFQERCRRILVPQLSVKPNAVWDIRKDDFRLGSGEWWMPWQQALGVYGLDLAGEILDVPAIRAVALAGAKKVMADAWVRVDDAMDPADGRLVEYEVVALDGRRVRSGMFTTAWLPLAVATVLRHESGNALARELWQQIVADAGGDGKWLPPESMLVR